MLDTSIPLLFYEQKLAQIR